VSVAIGKYLALAAASLSLGLATAHAHAPWITLPDCRYVPNPSNDGDSFHVRAGRKEYIFRLYFVDAAETESGLSERTEEQAEYFGITLPLTLKVGEAAKEFTRRKLQQPFTVRTCRQDALGRSKRERFYAFVQVEKKDLGEELVANGLARLHGTASQAPGLVSPEREWEELRRLEREAKTQKVGGWAPEAEDLRTGNPIEQQRSEHAAEKCPRTDWHRQSSTNDGKSHYCWSAPNNAKCSISVAIATY
jgi:endonuclease YncB( thermonuclease family)